jgi:ParB family chromosome partitioning protein
MRASWKPTVASYLGRVPKALIQEAVAEAVSSEAAARIAGLKKVDMASAAEDMLKDSGWLPKQLRSRGASAVQLGPFAADLSQAAEQTAYLGKGRLRAALLFWTLRLAVTSDPTSPLPNEC